MELLSSCARRSHVGLSKEEEVPKPTIAMVSEDEWKISFGEKFGAASKVNAAASWEKVSIYKIPCYLIDTSASKAYIPQTVSLGPYHHGKTHLQQMEAHKWRALQHVLKRTGHDKELYLDSMRELENRARACYEGPLDHLNSYQFAEMMLLDGCFILEILLGATLTDGFERLGYTWNDPIFSMGGALNFIQRDMIMLENQIPLFVLDALLGFQSRNPHLIGAVAPLVISFFDPLMRNGPLAYHLLMQTKSDEAPWIFFGPWKPPDDLDHCLDVFRRSLIYEQPYDQQSPEVDVRRQQLISCATELKDAGIKFRKQKTTKAKLWDIEFKKGTLYIPPILIHDGTKSFLFNFIAFEQCHLACRKDITSYIFFLDNLIDSAEDVKYLHKHGIIEHLLGSDDEVARLVNGLGKEVFYINDLHFLMISKQINECYNSKRRIWLATLKSRYFNNPWSIISFVAGVFLLIMTAAQAFYAVYGYFYPRS